MYDAVMNLRSDPTANALMAGAFTRINAGKLAERLGRAPTEGELYVAHFLGATGAGRLIALADAAPSTPAAAVFPGPARANPTIFFDARGNQRSVSEVYRSLVGRYDVARGSPPSTPSMVAADSVKAPEPKPYVPDTAQVAQAYAAAMPPTIRDSGPAFHNLFRTGATDEAVAPLISALWSTPAPVAEEEPKPQAAAKPKPVAKPEPLPEPSNDKGQLGLFQDQVPDARALFRGRV
jgi:hypothetical protein